MTTDAPDPQDSLADTLTLSISLLRLRPGDTLVIKVADSVDYESARVLQRIAEDMLERAGVPRTGYTILYGDVELSIVRPEPDGPVDHGELTGRTPAPSDVATPCGSTCEYEGVTYRCDLPRGHEERGNAMHEGPPVPAQRAYDRDKGRHIWLND